VPTRGRVIACADNQAVVRTDAFDLTITNPPRGWRAGQLVEIETGTVVRDFAGDYPDPASEVMRMPRGRIDHLRARANALATVRDFFAARGFLEVETPLLVPSPGLEIHLDAVRAGAGYLITSPEYQMKRLLAAGFEKIYQVCKCFRGNERGVHHSGEFTMIEWYRAYEDLDAIARDVEQLVHAVCGDHARVGDRRIDVRPPWRRLTVRDALHTYAGVHIDGGESAEQLIATVRAAGIPVADDSAWDDAFFAAFLARVEPALAELDHAMLLIEWPAPLAALARKRDAKTALRFEAYVGGVELANAFDELTDPDDQRARFVDDQRVRAARGKPVYPIDDKLVAALREGLPPCAGVALGFDRLVMLATGAAAITDVVTFSTDEL
jgi:lysyl-tRNA synthetase class 2